MSWKSLSLGDALSVKHGFAFKSTYFSDRGPFLVLTPCNFHGAWLVFVWRTGKDRWYTGHFPEEYILSETDIIVAMTEQGPWIAGKFSHRSGRQSLSSQSEAWAGNTLSMSRSLIENSLTISSTQRVCEDRSVAVLRERKSGTPHRTGSAEFAFAVPGRRITGPDCRYPFRLRRSDRKQPAADCTAGTGGAGTLPGVVRPAPLSRP